MRPRNPSFAYLKALLCPNACPLAQAAIRKVCAIVAESTYGTCLVAYRLVQPVGDKKQQVTVMTAALLQGQSLKFWQIICNLASPFATPAMAWELQS